MWIEAWKYFNNRLEKEKMMYWVEQTWLRLASKDLCSFNRLTTRSRQLREGSQTYSFLAAKKLLMTWTLLTRTQATWQVSIVSRRNLTTKTRLRRQRYLRSYKETVEITWSISKCLVSSCSRFCKGQSLKYLRIFQKERSFWKSTQASEFHNKG